MHVRYLRVRVCMYSTCVYVYAFTLHVFTCMHVRYLRVRVCIYITCVYVYAFYITCVYVYACTVPAYTCMHLQYGSATRYKAFAFHTRAKRARNAFEIFVNAFHSRLLRVSSPFAPRFIAVCPAFDIRLLISGYSNAICPRERALSGQAYKLST